jgi:ATPase subunit of ABC transporter with duplicated ATPase domains
MLLLSVCNASINFGWGSILNDVSFDISEGERVGLVGKNGCGKSTLFRVIVGEETLTSGHCAISHNCTIGYFRQIENFSANTTVREIMLNAYPELAQIKHQMTELEKQMGEPDCDYEQLLPQYSILQEKFEHLDGYSVDVNIEKSVNSFGFSVDVLDRPFDGFSGGEKTMLLLARAMINSPNLLLLDEPTNHLDLKSIEWLEAFLREFKGAVLAISHDRYFLDRTVKKIIEINNRGSCDVYFGNYSTYILKKKEKQLRDYEEYENQQKEIQAMKKSIATLKDWGNRGGNLGLHRRAESIQRKLERLDVIDKPIEDRKVEADFTSTNRSGKDVLVLEAINKSYSTKTVLCDINLTLRYGDKIGILGENGAGKSTLIKLILGVIEPDSGVCKIGANVKIGYIPQELDCFTPEKSILYNFMREYDGSEASARSILAQFLFTQDDVYKLVKSLSGGELVRLRLCQLMQQDVNLLILDEPTNHLDILSRETIEQALLNYEGTAIIVSHDRYFLDKVVSRIVILENNTCKEFYGNYSDFITQVDNNQ